jgi:hypothetical protein
MSAEPVPWSSSDEESALDLLDEFSALLDAEYGPVSEDALAEARRLWPDAR